MFGKSRKQILIEFIRSSSSANGEYPIPPLDPEEITAIVAAKIARCKEQRKPNHRILVLVENTYCADKPKELSSFVQSLCGVWSAIPINSRWQIILMLDNKDDKIHWTYVDLQKQPNNGLSVIIHDAAGFNAEVEERVRKILINQLGYIEYKINGNILGGDIRHRHGPYCGAFALDTAFQVRKIDIHNINTTLLSECLTRLSRISQDPNANPGINIADKTGRFREKTLKFLTQKTFRFFPSISEADYLEIQKNRTGINVLKAMSENPSDKFISPAQLKILW